MNRKLLVYLAAWLVAVHPALALNDTIGVTVGSGKTANLISFGNASVISETGICDATTINQCAAVSAAGAISIAGAVTNGGTFAVQLTGATNNINNIAGTVSLPTGAATSALQTTGNTALTTINTTLGSPFQAGGNIGNTSFASTQSGIWTSRVVGNIGGVLDAIGQNVTAPANWLQAGCQFTTSPTTITTGNGSPLACDNANRLLAAVTNTVNVNGSGVTQPTSAASGQYVDGAIATLGTQADAACASDTGTCTLVALEKRRNQTLTTLNTTAGAAATLAAAATGGCTGGTLLTAATNNATVIGSAAAHTLCWLRWENTTTSLVDIRLYDTATAPSGGAPCNSATNVVSNDVVQSNATSPGGVANLGPFGHAFANGVVICVTGANANNDNTNAVTGINISYGYK
jgi:fibronectin-binding autotransporter adhesin